MQRQDFPEKIRVESEAEVKIPYYGTCKYISRFFAELNKEAKEYRSDEGVDEWTSVSSNQYGCPSVQIRNSHIPLSTFEQESRSFVTVTDVKTPGWVTPSKRLDIKTEEQPVIGREITGHTTLQTNLFTVSVREKITVTEVQETNTLKY